MIINTLRPIKEFRNATCPLGPVAILTAWNNVINCITSIIIYAIYSITDECSIKSIIISDLKRWLNSTVMTGHFANFSKLIFGQFPYMTTSFCAALISINLYVKGRFTFGKGRLISSVTPATFGPAGSQFKSSHDCFIAANTVALPQIYPSLILSSTFDDRQSSMDISCLVDSSRRKSLFSNEVGMITPATLRDSFSQVMSSDDAISSAGTNTAPQCSTRTWLRIFNNSPSSISLASLINIFWHNISPVWIGRSIKRIISLAFRSVNIQDGLQVVG